MYLIKYNDKGNPSIIIPNPEKGQVGIYVNELPITLNKLIELKLVDIATENNKEYYILKEEN